MFGDWILLKLFSSSGLLLIVLLNCILTRETYGEPYRHQRCSSRLENALKNMRRRSLQVSKSRFIPDQTPYSVYHSIYGPQNDDSDRESDIDRGLYAKHLNRGSRPFTSNSEATYPYDSQRQPHKISIPKVEVEDLRVKLPQSAASRWVEVDKCNFSTENSTLDTRLLFPDLTISGRVILQPTGGKCSMILRLRHAGIEFRTIPIGFGSFGNEESRRIGAASVRTDSHFAEPGFISVFAHSCQLASGNRLRQNSKRRFGFVNSGPLPHSGPDVHITEPEVYLGTGNTQRWGKYYNSHKADYDIRTDSLQHGNSRDYTLEWDNSESGSREFIDPNADNFYRRKFRYRRDLPNRMHRRAVEEDQMSFNDDILNIGDDFQELVEPDARAFANIFSGNQGDRNEPDEVLTKDMENLFSMGVRGLLTTYMQRALQPAIKETLMENMGYILSYG